MIVGCVNAVGGGDVSASRARGGQPTSGSSRTVTLMVASGSQVAGLGGEGSLGFEAEVINEKQLQLEALEDREQHDPAKGKVVPADFMKDGLLKANVSNFEGAAPALSPSGPSGDFGGPAVGSYEPETDILVNGLDALGLDTVEMLSVSSGPVTVGATVLPASSGLASEVATVLPASSSPAAGVATVLPASSGLAVEESTVPPDFPSPAAVEATDLHTPRAPPATSMSP